MIPGERNRRIQKYKELLPRFLQVKAVAFSSDYAAIEAMNFLSDHGIKVPEQVIRYRLRRQYLCQNGPSKTYNGSSGCQVRRHIWRSAACFGWLPGSS
ncbi:MAG: hypothetical protein ACLURP_15775 [Ruminococcus sp.]